MSWKVLKISLQDILKTSWRRLEDVLKKYGPDEYIFLDPDIFWRRKAKANIFVLIKTSWLRPEEVFWRRRRKTSSLRRMFAGIESPIKTNTEPVLVIRVTNISYTSYELRISITNISYTSYHYEFYGFVAFHLRKSIDEMMFHVERCFLLLKF